MAMRTGTVSWGDADTRSSTGLFMRLEQGKNRVRILSKGPTQFYQHYIPNNVDGKFITVKCTSDSNTCPACLKAKQANSSKERESWSVKPRWYIQVLDRKDGGFKILEIPNSIVTAIKELSEDPDWGPTHKYDVTITRNPKGANPLYRVQASPPVPSPLTDKEREEAKTFLARKSERTGLLLVDSLAKPPSVEEVNDRLNLKPKNGDGNGSDHVTAKSKTKSPSSDTSPFDDDEEQDVQTVFKSVQSPKATSQRVDDPEGLDPSFVDDL
jgi:hypothetical protein